ncbi:MurR/RpiR family transcriptional regulator [Phaeovulum sp.]|uniref:MurR/RpiR family transcriptional regulator n=1 Tax=Phaeovulum sp. TaxID=2934796 RepID=UPI0039E5944E
MTIRDRLTDGSVPLTRSDLKVARTLLSNYPAAGLNTVAHLAQAAGVSGPTVVRFVGRLGFEGYPDFQRALLGEVQERMSSPLSMMNAGKGAVAPDNIYLESMRSAGHAVETTMSMVPSASFDKAVELAIDPSLSVHCIGGRFSGYLAGMLWSHLKQLRPGCHWVQGARSDQVDALVDLGRRSLVIVYDYRRYQIDTVQFARTAAAQGAKIVLFTDPYASPIAGVADVILTAPVESLSPYDTMVPALAQTEALIAALTLRQASKSRRRIEQMEALRHASSVTEDAWDVTAQGETE